MVAAMAEYEIKMKHSGETLEALSRMQFDLFGKKSRMISTVLSAALVVAGVLNYSSWWGITLIAYGAFLYTGMYLPADRKAHKLSQQLKAAGLDYPASLYLFEKDGLRVLPLPQEDGDEGELTPYSRILRLGEDLRYYYLFRDEYGGYMIPKDSLGDDEAAFRQFIEKKTGRIVEGHSSPLRRLMSYLRRRNDEPPHL